MTISNKLKIKFKSLYGKLYGGSPDFSVSYNKKIIEKAYLLYSKQITDGNTLVASLGRCAAQFNCQNALRSKTAINILEVSSAIFFPFFLIYWFLKAAFRKTHQTKFCDGVKFISGPDGPYFEIPGQLTVYKIENYARAGSGYFTKDDLKLILQTIWFAFKDRENKYKFLFLLKLFYNLSALRPLIDTYSLSFCCCFMEYNFSSSVVTWYLNSHGIKTYNIMHGEKFYYCRDAFVSFDRFYVWNAFYSHMFKEMYAEVEFVVFRPKRFSLDLSMNIKKGIGILFPPTLRSKSEMTSFIEMMQKISVRDWTVTVRYHPSYVHLFNGYRRLIPEGINISDPKRESVRDFLENSDLIIGFYSTVLVEAAMNGRFAVYIKDTYLDAIKDYYFIFKHENVHILESQLITPVFLDNLVSKCCHMKTIGC